MRKRIRHRSLLRSGLILFLITAPAFASAPPAQTPPGSQQVDPSFDVATIRISDSTAPMMEKLNQEGRHFTTRNTSLSDLIQFAYDVQARQIVDPSGLTTKDRYDISAVTSQDGSPTVQQVRRMLQRLLTDRYAMSFHRDKRALPAFVLTTTSTPPKLKPTESSGPIPINDFQSVSNGWTLSMRNASTTDFARFLQTIVFDRPVVDSTGLAGKFDISVTFTPDDRQFHGHPPPARRADNGDTAPGLFEAIKQQLGLRLEQRKVMVDVMVLDRIKAPSPN